MDHIFNIMNTIAPVDPTNIWAFVQEAFNLTTMDSFFYLLLSTIFILIFKNTRELYKNYKERKKAELETLLTEYIEIQNLIEKSYENGKISEEKFLAICHRIRQSYTFIEYKMYRKLDELLHNDSMLDEKITQVRTLLEVKTRELILLKNEYINYDTDLKAPLRQFLFSSKDILVPIGLSFAIMLSIFTLFLLILIQPNNIELFFTVFALGLVSIFLYYLDELKKINYIPFKILFITQIVSLMFLIFLNGIWFVLSSFSALFLFLCLILLTLFKRKNLKKES